jgi:hypothetical protein
VATSTAADLILAAVCAMALAVGKGVQNRPVTTGRRPRQPDGTGPAAAGRGDLANAVALVCAETGMTQREAERFVSLLD